MNERETSSSLGTSVRNDVVIVLLALASVVLLVMDVAAELAPSDQRLIATIDLVIALVFLVEWIARFAKAKAKLAFFRSTWWELLASIPITNGGARALRGLRLLRAVRLARVLRVVRLGVRLNVLIQRARAFNEGTHLIGITTSVASIVFCGALAFHHFEYGTNPHVHSLWDSTWWAIITVTTVGYGDIAPTTTGGRLVTIALLMVGLGAFGLYTAAIANYVVTRQRRGAIDSTKTSLEETGE